MVHSHLHRFVRRAQPGDLKEEVVVEEVVGVGEVPGNTMEGSTGRRKWGKELAWVLAWAWAWPWALALA